MPVTASMDADDGPMVFSSNPNDYNRVTCLACMATVKVHHLRKHMVAHGLTMGEYKDMYGEEMQYVKKVHHKCGICKQPMLFDLDTLYNHVSSFHQVKVKEYVDLYLGPIADMESALNNQSHSNVQLNSSEEAPVDEDGAPIIGLNLKRTLDIAEDMILKKSKLSNLNTNSADVENNKPLVSVHDAPEGQVPNCYSTSFLERIQEQDCHGNLISNDFADYALVECKICHIHTPMTRLRSHTKSTHKTTITEYKAQFGADLVPIEIIYHRCGICGELVLLDSDHIAVHLKRPGHYITHKNYNDGYMVDSRSSKYNMTKRVFRDKQPPPDIQFLQQNQPELNIKERSKRKARIPYNEAEYDLSNFVESPSPTYEQEDFDDLGEFGEPTVVMENIEQDIFDDENDNKPPVFKSLQLSSTNKKLDVLLLDGLDDGVDIDFTEVSNNEKEVEEIVLDSDDEEDTMKDAADVENMSNHIISEQDSIEIVENSVTSN